MVLSRLQHEVSVTAPPGTVYAHLADPQSYVGLSPLVVRVEDVRPGATGTGRRCVEYVAVERFGRGVLHWDNRIRVTLIEDEPGRRLVSLVTSPGAVRLRVVVDLALDPAGTRVTETIRVECPLVLRSFVVRTARAVQLRRAAELARRMAEVQRSTR